MTGYELPLGCPKCEGPLEHITSALTTGSETSAIVRCVPCRREWQVLVRLLAVAQPASERRQRERAAARERAAV